MKTLTLNVSQFNTFIKRIFDAEEFLHNVSIFGEVTNFKISGGHAYFDLKDQAAMLSCVWFGCDNPLIKNGDQITVFGKPNFYVKSGRFNFVVAKAEAFGMGELYQKFLMLKDSLEKEGLFREEIKKPIPELARRIGVVTSETGAVIRDIINVTRSKNLMTDIVVYPSKVQGVGAEFEIVKGIEFFNSRDDIDTIIIARGGGSFEDLSPFNTEAVARAIFKSQKPIISAVGHETDFTICDFAADLRVPTPSVAAEVAVFDQNKLLKHISDIKKNNYSFITKNIAKIKDNLIFENALISNFIKQKAEKYRSKLVILSSDISNFASDKVQEKKTKLMLLAGIISKLNPLEILKSGYAAIEKQGQKISSLSMLKEGDEINIKFSDGEAVAKVLRKEG